MEFYVLPIFAFLCLALVLGHASLPSEVYWQTALPNTPVPKAIEDLLQSDKSGWLQSNIWDAILTDSCLKIFYCYKPTGKNPAAAAGVFDESIKNKVGIFFLEKDLHRGATMKLYFTKTHKGAAFLPRQVAHSIPFSSNNFPQILNRFSVKPKSMEAEVMKDTIVDCERPGNKGEDKYCAMSLESLIDFAFSELGKNDKNPFPLTTEVDGIGLEEYKIGGVVKIGSDKAVACHKMKYPYVVFYCHVTHDTRTYMVNINPLVVQVPNKADDKKMKYSRAIAICHSNTSAWDPNHLAFQVLKVKPGTVPICHFLSNGNIAWVSN